MPATIGIVQFYATGLAQYLAGNLPVIDPGELRGLLTTAGYVVDQEAHTDITDITNEVYGGDWPQGGVVLTGVSVTVVPAEDHVQFDFTTIEEADCNFSGGKRLIVYHTTPADPEDRTLFCAITFADTLSPVGGAVVIAAPSGLFVAGY